MLAGLKRRLQADFRPVEDDQIPQLVVHMVSRGRAAILLFVTVGCMIHLSDVARGRSGVFAGLLCIAIFQGTQVPLLLATFHARGKKLIQPIMVVSAIIAMFDVATMSLSHLDGSNAQLPFVGVVPLVVGGLVSWRSGYCFGLGNVGGVLAPEERISSRHWSWRWGGATMKVA